jgi:hypothetical protein
MSEKNDGEEVFLRLCVLCHGNKTIEHAKKAILSLSEMEQKALFEFAAQFPIGQFSDQKSELSEKPEEPKAATPNDRHHPAQETTHVPASGEFLLRLFLSQQERCYLPGDLEEEYKTVMFPRFGKWRADLWYWGQVFRTVGPLVGQAVRKAVKVGTYGVVADWISRRIGF